MNNLFRGEVAFGFGLGLLCFMALGALCAALGAYVPSESIVKYLNDNQGFFITVFTFSLFIATVLLWVTTKNIGTEQIKHLIKASEAELRAYVYLENAKHSYSATEGNWQIYYTIKNFGQTPAHRVSVVARARVVSWNSGRPKIPPIPIESDALGSMAPRGDFYEKTCVLENSCLYSEIEDGTKALYLVGRISYYDTLSSTLRNTDFRYYIGGSAGCAGDEMFADDGGNVST